MSSSPIHVVVADANVLVNLTHVSKLTLLARIPHYGFVVPDHVRDEISNIEERKSLDASIQEGWLKLQSITELDTLAAFTSLLRHLGRGEAACIAIAAKRGWSIASDEVGRFLREAEAHVGTHRILKTMDILGLAIKAGALLPHEVDPDKLALAEGSPRFRRPRFASH